MSPIQDIDQRPLCDYLSHSSLTGPPDISSSQVDPRVARSADAINQAFLTLLETKAFDQITIKEIVEAAGVHRATFFRHYPTKDDLLNRVAKMQITQLVERTSRMMDDVGNNESRRAFCAYIHEHRALWKVLLTGGAAPVLLEEWRRLAAKIAEERHLGSDWIPIRLTVRCSIGVVSETIVWWLSEAPASVGVAEIAEILNTLIAALARAGEEVPTGNGL